MHFSLKLAPMALDPGLHFFAVKDLLQHIDLARVLFGGMIPSRRDARYVSCMQVSAA
jgi:hypothetical protein